jgi:hypothetical protein
VFSLSRGKRRAKKPKPERKRNRLVYALIPVALCIIVLAYLFWPSPEHSTTKEGVTIVDLFYSSQPQFTDDALVFLSSQGLETNTFTDSNITVDFYRELPQYGYNLIILRVHAGVLESDPAKPTFLFTDEPFNTFDHLVEQLLGHVESGKINPDNPAEDAVFTIGPQFVIVNMDGSFNDSIIVLSSCLGLYTTELADAFVQKGATAFISWDEKVSLSHTDDACMLLLTSLITDEMTIDDAVRTVMTEVGPDTAYDSTLKYYPTEAGSLKLEDIR